MLRARQIDGLADERVGSVAIIRAARGLMHRRCFETWFHLFERAWRRFNSIRTPPRKRLVLSDIVLVRKLIRIGDERGRAPPGTGVSVVCNSRE